MKNPEQKYQVVFFERSPNLKLTEPGHIRTALRKFEAGGRRAAAKAGAAALPAGKDTAALATGGECRVAGDKTELPGARGENF